VDPGERWFELHAGQYATIIPRSDVYSAEVEQALMAHPDVAVTVVQRRSRHRCW
jgi:hypothetical protein